MKWIVPLFATLALSLLFWLPAPQAQAVTCSASMSNVNFGSVSLRTGETHTTTGAVDISCSNALVSTVGVCIHFGNGSGGAAGGARYMTSGGSQIAYQLRSGGFGSSNPAWDSVYVLVPVVLGSGNLSVPVYAEILSTGVDKPIGTYSSTFSGAAAASIDYGVATCDLAGSTAVIPDFTVSASVTSGCEVDGATLNFGTMSGVIASAVTAQTNIVVRCTAGTGYSVRLSNGNGSGATGPEDRRMTFLTQTLKYGLYQDSAHSQPWGNTAALGVSSSGLGSDQSFPVYGRIPGGQTVGAGAYSDTVLITVEYN